MTTAHDGSIILLANVPVPDPVACHLYQDPIWKGAILNNTSCHKAISPLTKTADRNGIGRNAYRRGLSGGNLATLDMYLKTRIRETLLADLALNNWTLSYDDQLRFVQNNLPAKLLTRAINNPDLAPRVRLEIAKRALKNSRTTWTVIDYLRHTGDVFGNTDLVAEIITKLGTGWLEYLPGQLLPDTPELADQLWGIYNPANGGIPAWFAWTATFGTTETATSIVRWLTDPTTGPDIHSKPVQLPGLRTGIRVLLARPDLPAELRKQLRHTAKQVDNFEEQQHPGWQHRTLDAPWIQATGKNPIDLATSENLDQIRETLQTLRKVVDAPDMRTSGAKPWHLRCVLQAGINPAVIADLETSREVMASLAAHVLEPGLRAGSQREPNPNQSQLLAEVAQQLTSTHGLFNLPRVPDTHKRRPRTIPVTAPAVSQHTPWNSNKDRPVREQSEKELLDEPVVNWWKHRESHCPDGQHGCWVPYHETGTVLRNTFGENINQWRLFLGLVDACVEPATTFRQLVDLACQLTQADKPNT